MVWTSDQNSRSLPNYVTWQDTEVNGPGVDHGAHGRLMQEIFVAHGLNVGQIRILAKDRVH